MPEHIKIVLNSRKLPAAAVTLLQFELHTPVSALETKIAAGEPILDAMPHRHSLDDFIKSSAALVRLLDNLGIEYSAWINDNPVTPQHLRGVLSRQHRIQQKMHGDSHDRIRPDLGDD